MRLIFKQSENPIELQQGTILNGCRTDVIEGEAYGLIITPRCDIGNGGKVRTVHYLPIISLETWIKTECFNKCRAALRDKKRDKLLKDLEQMSLSPSLIDVVSIEDILKVIPDKHRTLFVDDYNEYKQLKDSSIVSDSIVKSCKDDFARLCKGTHSRYYLIESWLNDGHYYVIILRDIKRMKYDFAMKFVRGFQEKSLDEIDYYENDIYRSDQNYLYKTVAQITSPYIEHIIQSFSHNFCRIGVEEIEHNLLTTMNIKDILQ